MEGKKSEPKNQSKPTSHKLQTIGIRKYCFSISLLHSPYLRAYLCAYLFAYLCAYCICIDTQRPLRRYMPPTLPPPI